MKIPLVLNSFNAECNAKTSIITIYTLQMWGRELFHHHRDSVNSSADRRSNEDKGREDVIERII